MSGKGCSIEERRVVSHCNDDFFGSEEELKD